MNIKFMGNNNTNKSSRNGCKIIAIVDHITACDKRTAIDWFTSSNNKESSAHYLVCKDGSIYQFVDESMKAWHAGIVQNPSSRLVLQDMKGVNPNAFSIGVEHEGQSGDQFTEVQYQSTLWLHTQIIAKYGIIIDREHIIGHYQVDSVDRAYCPGSGFPWDRLMVDLISHFVPQPQIQPWQIDCMNFLKISGFIVLDHNPNETVVMSTFGFMMNNYFSKLQNIDPIQYLTINNFIGQPHLPTESITWALLGWILARRKKVNITDPISFLLNSGYITSSKVPTDIITFSLLGAVLKNATTKNIGI